MSNVKSAAHIIKNGLIDEIFRDANKLIKVIEAVANIQYYGGTRVGLITLNSCQRKIVEKVVEQYIAGLPVRIMIAKSRRIGGSMITAILYNLLMMGKKNFRAVVAANEKEKVSKYLHDLYTIMLDHLPDALSDFRGAHNRTHRGDGHRLKKNRSMLSVEVESKLLGRASDALHCSEFAFFKDGQDFLNTYHPSLTDSHGTFSILESTPSAYDDHFHRMFERALSGKRAYSALFFAWWQFEENRMYCSAEEEKQIMNGLHIKHPTYGNEQELVDKYNVQADQLKWRRYRLDDTDLDSFYKLYPASIEEAFQAADSRNVFDMAVLRGMEKKEPIKQGIMNVNRPYHWEKPPAFELQPQGLIQIWQDVDRSQEYVAGSDHSQGRGDWNSLTIMQRMPLRVVATLHGDRTRHNIIPAEFAAQMFHLLKYYNQAHTAIEINDTGLVISRLLQQWNYPYLLNHQQMFPNDKTNEFGGWRNTTTTRPYAIERLKYFIKNQLIYIPDELTIKEMMHFVYVAPQGDLSREKAQAARKGQTPRAGDNTGIYDDRVFSLMSALLAHEALEAPKSDREKAIEAQQVDHDILYSEQHDFDYTNNDFDFEIPFAGQIGYH